MLAGGDLGIINEGASRVDIQSAVKADDVGTLHRCWPMDSQEASFLAFGLVFLHGKTLASPAGVGH